MNQRPVLELRVALTTKQYERLSAFYTEGLGLTPETLWTEGKDRALIFDMGRATLELFDEAHAEVVDELEVGRRLSGPVRFALQVPDVDAALARFRAWGATVISAPVTTPWGHRNARVADPDGMQVTLFEVAASTRAEP